MSPSRSRRPLPPRALGRRALLRGVAAGGVVSVALPLLDIMLDSHGTALADGSPLPVRLVTWFFGNGVNRARWVPGGMLSPVVGPAYPLSYHLQPLAEVAEYVSVPSGYRNMCANKITHHEGMTLFNAYTFDQSCPPDTEDCGMGFYSNAAGPTIDQIAADALAGATPVSSVQIGVSKRISGADFGTTMHALSHRGPSQPLPPERDPRKIFYSLFGNLPRTNDPERPVRLEVLSAVREQAKRLDARLGKKDKERLEAHLDGVRELETKIQAVVPLCEMPDEPMEGNEDSNGVEPLSRVNRVMSDLLAFAFSCDITRVASVMFHEGASDTMFPGAEGFGHHQNSHTFALEADGTEVDYGGLEGFNTGLLFTMTELGYFLNKLKTTEDTPTTNLLDNAAILIGSDCMDGFSHDFDDKQNLACLVAGRGGGRLVHPGIHLIEEQRNVCDVSLTVLRAAVPGVASIGRVGLDPPATSTPVEALTAADAL